MVESGSARTGSTGNGSPGNGGATAADRRKRETLPPCDLVMQGGVTSAVVYPAAACALHDRYRFCSVGGASAGAIAAATVAAAEFGRESGGFERLAAVGDELCTPGLLEGLFQPSPATAAVLEVFKALQRKQPLVQKAATATAVLVRRLWPWPVVGKLATVGGLGLLVRGCDPARARARKALVPVAGGGALLGLGAGVAARLWRIWKHDLPENYYGMCLGLPVEGSSAPALTGWLHEKIQECAGLDKGAPSLTFADLAEKDIKLQMMVTDLSRARPVRVPFEAEDRYLLSLKQFERLFPPAVMDELRKLPADERDADLRSLRTGELPVIVAARLSLSFPVLLAAVPVWMRHDGVARQHWLSDGGISSNFPIHFFDAWLPSRPTFGLALVPAPRAGDSHDDLGRTAEIEGTFEFGYQIFDTLQNWRDVTQAELPGFADRVRAIALDHDEGGLNLAMSADTIRSLIARGRKEAEALDDGFVWEEHRRGRYRSLMSLLQQNLHRGPPQTQACTRDTTLTDAFSAELQAQLAGVTGRGEGPAAVQATNRLLQQAQEWFEAGVFQPAEDLRPPPVMRVTPKT